MKIKKILLVTGLVFGISIVVSGQNRKAVKAYETFDAGEYYAAIDEFKRAYQQISDKKEKLNIAFHIAECYRITNNSTQAALWYSKVVAKDYENPVAILYYADALKMNQNYEEALAQYMHYKDLVPDDPRGADGILSCDQSLSWIENPTGYQVEEMKFIDSKFSDYSPAYSRDDYQGLYFTSSREETTGNMEHGGTGQSFSDIFYSTMDKKGKWSTPLPLTEPVNTEAEEGTPVLSGDYNTLYFTRCNVSKRKPMGCEIYRAERQGETWGKEESLGIASDSLVIAHPAISVDELTLYFVSDMEGSIKSPEGKNSKDIWMVSRTDARSKWGDPVNMGKPINTPGDEVFPYIHADGTLYFSSNGHAGMGGLDIFKAKKTESGQWEIENMKYPINSSSDDFGIIFEKDRESGYFSSSRKGKGDDDIYSFLLPPLKFSIIGTVRNEKTDEVIPEALVKSIGSDGITLETNTTRDGSFRFTLKPGTDYVFIAEKKGFLKGKERESTKGISQSTEFKTQIYLASVEIPIELENIFFDLDKADLRPESMVSLDRLVETLNDNPTIVIELGSHTDYRATDEYNNDLSRRRAQSVVNYLIEKGIARDRLVAKGYGESAPKVVDKKDNDAYPFLAVGTTLTEKYITSLADEDQQEMANFLNRRTEFKVLREDYSGK
ncbi:MAG: ompA 2 [Bacteroidetes bacterium]|jgi:peptidoglycan-associated lipoprotein|nr:ompA 2 [Bacteroidota bacterium]